MTSTAARPVQGYDNFGKPLTSFTEGGPIVRVPVPDDGKWHKVATLDGQARLRVLPSLKGVLYTTENASPGIADGAALAAFRDTSEAWPAGAFYPLSSAFSLDVYFAADPATAGDPPVVTVAHGAKDL
ncbi:hypothetical protein ACUXK4_004528 [Methylorubrum extorquens]